MSRSYQSGAQHVSWPAFGPAQGLLRLDGFTDTLPDFVGPIDGSAELTIFTEGNHYPVLLPLVLDRFPTWCKSTHACRVDAGEILIVTLPQRMVVDKNGNHNQSPGPKLEPSHIGFAAWARAKQNHFSPKRGSRKRLLSRNKKSFAHVVAEE